MTLIGMTQRHGGREMKKRMVHIKRFNRESVAVAAVLTVALVFIVIHGCGDLRELE